LTQDFLLQIISIHIIRGDRWIQIHLNIFKLSSDIKSLQQLTNVSGIQFHLPPNSITNMRFHTNDFQGIPLFNYDFRSNHHKLKRFFTQKGLDSRVKKLGDKIEKDLNDIDKYIMRWHKIYHPIPTTVDGKIEGLGGMTVNERLYISNLSGIFEKAKRNNKDYAATILKWLEVDEASIKKIIG